MCRRRPSKCCAVAVLVGLVVATVVGGVLFGLRQQIYELIIDKNLVILPNSTLFKAWVDLPAPILTSIYFFNVTNSAAVEKGAKPQLVQVGPYVYREYHLKTRLRWNWSNFTVTYHQKRIWQFDAGKSNGSLSDKITTLNAVAASINSVAAGLDDGERIGLTVALALLNEKLFVTKTAEELLFKGYEDPILKMAHEKPWNKLLPPMPDRFGYFYPRNGSDDFDGVFNMHTGQDDIRNMGQIAEWNYSRQLPFYPGRCGEVRGGGDFLSPGQNKTHVELFLNDLCRTLRLDYVRDGHAPSAPEIKGSLYRISNALFANKTVNPDNACFNPHGREVPSGVFNMSPCRMGAPIFMSQPHFYQADPFFLTMVGGGLRPSADRHETKFWVDRDSGLPFDVTARFQVNFHLVRVHLVPMFKELQSEAFFPTVWFETRVVLPSSLLLELAVLANVKYACVCVGLLLLSCGLAFLVTLVVYLVVAVTPFGRARGMVRFKDLHPRSSGGSVGSGDDGDRTGESLVDNEEREGGGGDT